MWSFILKTKSLVSTTGFVFKLYGGAVAWGSKLQSVTALTTTEAEVIATGAAGRDAIFAVQSPY